RNVLDLEQDEDVALVVVHRAQHTVEPAKRATPLDLFVLRGVLRDLGQRVHRFFAAIVRAVSVVRSDANADSVDPRANARAAGELAELLVHHEEDLLADVVEISLPNAEPSHRAPHERRARMEHRLERMRRRGVALLERDGSHECSWEYQRDLLRKSD